jgi:hypothetical protein
MAAHPGQELLVAVIDSGKLLMTEQSAVFVEDSRVMGALVGVDTADDSRRRCRHARQAQARTAGIGAECA